MGCISRFVVLLSIFTSWAIYTESVNPIKPKSYIISMSKDAKPTVFTTTHGWFSSVLHSAKLQALGGITAYAETETEASQGPLHLYSNVFHGFSASLTEEQVQVMESMPGVNGVIPDGKKELHTTHTPDFLGLNASRGLWPESKFGEDVIVAVLDTGIWPESSSFLDHNVGAVPRRWKGACEIDAGFNVTVCNRKLIGARYGSGTLCELGGELTGKKCVNLEFLECIHLVSHLKTCL